MEEIIFLLPYKQPFLFVDALTHIDENGAAGHYTYPEDSYFYQGHFPDYPITPGVMLIETMAQIGLVAFGIWLMRDKMDAVPRFAFTSSNVEFYKGVFPGEKVMVSSKKMYFRLGKLKAAVEMHNASGDLLAKGELSGMMLRKDKGAD